MCCCNVETVGFLLLNCDVAFGLWSREFVAFGVLWVLPSSFYLLPVEVELHFPFPLFDGK